MSVRSIAELMRASSDIADRNALRRPREDADRDYFARALAALG